MPLAGETRGFELFRDRNCIGCKATQQKKGSYVRWKLLVVQHWGRAFLMLIGLAIVSALPVRAADRDRLEAFLEITGFGVALDSIALAATDAPEMLGMSASDFGTTWTQTAEQVFDTARMRAMALDILEQTLEDDLLTHAAAFYASPLGQRLVDVENASHMVEDDAAKQEEGEALIADWVSEGSDRVALLTKLNTSVDSAGVAVRAVQEVQVRFLMAASYAGVLEVEFDEGTLRALLKEDEAALRMQMKRSGLANAAYTYQSLSDEELKDYLTALEYPQMQQVYELMNAVQYEIMANRFEALAVKMAQMDRGKDL